MARATFEIDRLSNRTLEFGIKTGATITGAATGFTLSKLAYYSTDYSAELLADATTAYDNALITKKYVDSKLSAISQFDANYYTEGAGIAFTETTGHKAIGLAPLTGAPSGLLYGYSAANDTLISDVTNVANNFVRGVKIDNYGRVTGIYTGGIATTDLSDINDANKVLDNYRQWNLAVGESIVNIGSGFGSATANLTFATGNGITLSLSSSTVTFDVNADTTNDFQFNQSTHKLELKQKLNSALANGLYTIAIDTAGRITEADVMNYATLTSNLNKFSAVADGIVNHLVDSGASANTATATTSTYFLTAGNTWAQIPYNKVSVATTTTTGSYALLAAATSDALTTTIKTAAVVDKDGNITATSFTGDGSGLTNINVVNLTADNNDKISKSLLPVTSILADLFTSGSLTGSATVALTDGTNVKQLANPTTAGKEYVLHVTSTSGPEWMDIRDLVSGIVAGEGGMIFKGLLDSTYAGNDGAYETDLPSTFKKGWFYRVAVAGTYGGQALEVGDAIYAIHDSTETATTYWAALQKNIDNAVTFTTTAPSSDIKIPVKTAGATAIADGISATLANSKYTLADTNIGGNAATATALATAVTLWGQTFDGSSNVTGALTGVTGIFGSGNIGSQANPFTAVYATTLYGTLSGTATEAGKVTNKLTITVGSTAYKYDGSSAESIKLDFGTLKTVAFAAKAANETGNVVSGFTTSTYNESGVTLNPTYTTALTGVSSSIFDITGSGATRTIGFLSTATAGAFYTGTPQTSSIATYNSVLTYAGKLYSTDASVWDGTSFVPVVRTLEYIDGHDNELLVATKDGRNSGRTQLAYSGYKVASSSASTSATDILTAEQVSQVVQSNVKQMTVSFSGTTFGTSGTIPANAVIDHIDVYVEKAYTNITTFNITFAGVQKPLVDNANIDVADDDDETFTYKFGKPISSSAGTISINATGATGAGAGKVYIYYI